MVDFYIGVGVVEMFIIIIEEVGLGILIYGVVVVCCV